MKVQYKHLHQRQIIYPFLLAIAFCLVVGGWYVYLMTKTLDRQEQAQTTHLAESALSAQLEELGNWARDYGFWDDALSNLVGQLNRNWANNNIGQYLYDSYGINQSYAIDSNNRTLIAYRDGQELANADLLANFPPALKSLLAKTRTTPPKNPQAACGVLRHHQQILLVAAAVITPENPGPEVRAEQPRPVLVLVRVLNKQMLASWSERYQLHNLQLLQMATPHLGSLPLLNPAGKALGQLRWKLNAPGTRLFHELLPLFAAVLLILSALTFTFLKRMGHFSAEKRQIEHSLSASEERLATALETTNIGLWDWDIASGDSYFDPTYYIMAGYAADEFPATHENFLQRIHPEDRNRVEQALNDHLSGTADKYEVEFRFRCKTSAWLWLKSRGRIIEFDADGKPQRMIGIHSDITARKQAEEARTALETQLHQKNKMEAIGNMAGGIAHDFNNILAIIISNAHLAQKKCGAEASATSHLNRIQEATSRARDLINQILSFSRQEQLSLRPLDLCATIDESLKLIQATIPSSVVFDNRIDPARNDIRINGDPTQLQRVLMNLCSNAVHAMREKGRLEIDLELVELDAANMPTGIVRASGCFAVLSVRDTGIGMDGATIKQIYDPFFTTKIVGQGTGMGLSVVHGIVESHHGFISVDSALKQGTTFKIYFPVHDGEIPVQTEDLSTLSAGNERILLVDDEQELANAIAETLNLLGYRVTATNSSRDALKIFETAPEKFDLVITDQTMPELSGLELAYRLLNIKADLPIVLCSGFSAKLDLAKARAAGIREFCSKPLEMQQLTAVIRRVLDKGDIDGLDSKAVLSLSQSG